MMSPLRILLLEDNSTDVEIIARILRKEVGDFEFRVEMTRRGFLQALEHFSPDIILSDNSMPQFNAIEALRITREKFIHIPFILITGTVSEEYATTILKEGADDYLLKDRLIRLPASIDAALKKRRAFKELTDYKYALDQSAIVAITNKDGVISYVNENLCELSCYRKDELIGSDYRIVNSGHHSTSFMNYLWSTISSGKSWRGELCNRAKNGSIYWVDCFIIPFLDHKKEPYQYLSIQTDVTEKKRLEFELLEQQKNEQVKITAMTLEAQEHERHELGRELHDNVNQILVGTKLLLSHLKSRGGNNEETLNSCIANLQEAINQNRRIAHELVGPDFDIENLPEQIQRLCHLMFHTSSINVRLEFNEFPDDLLNQQQKLALYRIAQEQCTNIVKHAFAQNVEISVIPGVDNLDMIVKDDGKGMDENAAINGTGIRNIRARLSILNGHATITTAPGQGFSLKVSMPLQHRNFSQPI